MPVDGARSRLPLSASGRPAGPPRGAWACAPTMRWTRRGRGDQVWGSGPPPTQRRQRGLRPPLCALPGLTPWHPSWGPCLQHLMGTGSSSSGPALPGAGTSPGRGSGAPEATLVQVADAPGGCSLLPDTPTSPAPQGWPRESTQRGPWKGPGGVSKPVARGPGDGHGGDFTWTTTSQVQARGLCSQVASSWSPRPQSLLPGGPAFQGQPLASDPRGSPGSSCSQAQGLHGNSRLFLLCRSLGSPPSPGCSGILRLKAPLLSRFSDSQVPSTSPVSVLLSPT